ncbi:uncharacterized protein TNCV_4671141 [Trichonephila clavipes]|nr:uncharacterized protein TNCV_4671141 [Trichonephila clavipes]
MDQINTILEHISTTVMPLMLPEKPDALEYAARHGQVRACIIYQEPNTKRVFVLFSKANWCQKKTRCIISSVPSWSLWCRANPNLFRRSFEPFDQMLNHRMVLEPHMVYPISAGTRYILVTVQKTVFSLDIIPKNILPQLMENGFNLGDFRKIKRYDQKAYKLPLPTSAHIARSTNASASPQPVIIPEAPVKIPPEQIPSVQILVTPELTTPPEQIPNPHELTTTTMQIPDPPMQIQVIPEPPQSPVQLFLSDLPVVEILEPIFTDDSSIDQIMSSYMETARNKGVKYPRLIPKNPRCLTRCFRGLTRVMNSSHSCIILKQG